MGDRFKEYAAKLRANIRRAKSEHQGILSESALGEHLTLAAADHPRHDGGDDEASGGGKKARKVSPALFGV